jgi:hypothetical protein
MNDNKNVTYKLPKHMALSVMLVRSFDWYKTTQGHDYWAAVYHNLRMIEEANK